MLLIGSRVIMGVPATDTDIMCSYKDFRDILYPAFIKKFGKVDVLRIQQDYITMEAKGHKIPDSKVDIQLIDADTDFSRSSKEFYDYAAKRCFYDNTYVLDNVELFKIDTYLEYALKLSHKFKGGGSFSKTRNFLIQNEHYWTGYCDQEFIGIMKRREMATYKKAPNLNQGKATFFTDNVKYIYDHDTIHDAIKHLDKPAYTYYMLDGAEVMCDKQKFNDCPNIVRLYGVLEESYVLALERAVIPYNTERKKAFDIALEKVCTTITSGWFRDFAYENYEKVQDLYHHSYVEKFQDALNCGKIKPFKQ